MPVVVVSNTVSGRAVREECREHGLDALIGAYVCSDEIGVRKPDTRIVDEALAIAGADPARTWFLGDKPENDALAARACGVARRVLVRGGSTPDPELDAALASGLATEIVGTPGDLVPLVRTSRLAPVA
jgi:FMN phosphatase YigB (HAD superfamily)